MQNIPLQQMQFPSLNTKYFVLNTEAFTNPPASSPRLRFLKSNSRACRFKIMKADVGMALQLLCNFIQMCRKDK